MSNSMNPVFVMVFAGNCPACKTFKSNSLSDLKDALKNYPGVTAIEYDVKLIGDLLPNDSPKDLNKYVKFYPCFLLIPGSVWNNALKGASLKNVLLYGATVNSEGKIIMLPTTMATRDSLMEWIRNNVEHDVSFRAGPMSHNEDGRKMIPTEGSVCSFKILSKR